MKKLDMKQKSTTVGGVGFKWMCVNENWTSAWHFTYNGAAKYAYAHEVKKPTHETRVFSV